MKTTARGLHRLAFEPWRKPTVVQLKPACLGPSDPASRTRALTESEWGVGRAPLLSAFMRGGSVSAVATDGVTSRVLELAGSPFESAGDGWRTIS